MIIYSATKTDFQADMLSNNIENKIHEIMYAKTHRRVSDNEVRSWKNSLQYMDRVLTDDGIPADSSIAIEYGIPQSSKRIDFIIAGQNKDKVDSVVIVELKQWETLKKTRKDAIVETFVAGRNREVEHPSYQAWTYASLLRDYNEPLHDGNIQLKPCAYLHNCDSADSIRDPHYKDYLTEAPVFIKREASELQKFIKKNVVYGDANNVLYYIENGKIKPSKHLADSLVSMLAGNREFIMIDEQKVIFESIKHAAVQSEKSDKKQVIIVEGGPGTGKSVVAVNLLVEITNMEKVVQYVSKNSAPREVYKVKLKGHIKKASVDNLFKGSGGYHAIEADTFDMLLVDEAHRLNEKSGMFSNLGENQVKEIIEASRVAVFFVDDDQVVTFKDIGRKSEIENWAKKLNADVKQFKLTSQFRCNGSTAYTAWLDNVLDVRETANFELDPEMYDFRVFDDPNEMRKAIEEKNLQANRARIVAGYCWNWVSKKERDAYDIEFPDFNFKMRWNLNDHGMRWIIEDESVSEAGCIHTCQGLELDYVGVIVGNDLLYREGLLTANPDARAKTDQSIKGYKKLLKQDPVKAKKKAESIIKNTYKTLMTRGQKGCFVYCTDPETREYFKSFLTEQSEKTSIDITEIPFPVLASHDVDPYVNSIPLFHLKAAAGAFSEAQSYEEFDWVELPEYYTAREGYFICQVIGESMNKKIPNGSWCLFRQDQGGSREGKVVLVEHCDIQDQDGHGNYTVKTYHSQKVETEEGWKHSKIVLRPNSFFTHYEDIVLDEHQSEELKVVGEFVAVLS
jgi:DUF2075 family protein